MLIKVWNYGQFWLGKPYTKRKDPIDSMDKLFEHIEHEDYLWLELQGSQAGRWMIIRVASQESWEETDFVEAIKLSKEYVVTE